MKSKVAVAEECVTRISDGARIMVGGFGVCGIPENLIRLLVAHGAKDLTIISNNAGLADFGVGLLISNGQVKKMISTYVGENPVLEEKMVNGEIEVELTIEADNNYEYLVFEDMKPAGCEPVELRSGSTYAGGLVANMELRDEKVVFFVGWLRQGEHTIKYKIRAEIPGDFHVLPTKSYAMYAPKVRAISDELRMGIQDVD